MKVVPAFNSTRATVPVHNLGTGQLAWALAHDPILRQRTEAVRSATDPAQLKHTAPRHLPSVWRGFRPVERDSS